MQGLREGAEIHTDAAGRADALRFLPRGLRPGRERDASVQRGRDKLPRADRGPKALPGGGIGVESAYETSPKCARFSKGRKSAKKSALSGNDAILEAARVRAAQERAAEEYDRRVQELLADRQREWAERQQRLF